jgi:hypothetical protein
MRIWSVHPCYLDAKGLLALWRETLLARKVLMGLTKGYKNHPQLNRFRSCPDPVMAIDAYLSVVAEESAKRGYKFDVSKFKKTRAEELITVTNGQMRYETEWLRKKLAQRNQDKLTVNGKEVAYRPHPLFKVIDGDIESWEKQRGV